MRKRLFTLLSLLCPLLIAAGVSAEVYTVAGNNATLFGTTWDPGNTANEMSTTDDVNYTFTKENVTLTAGTVEFKVVKGHSWGTEYPSSNYILNIPADAKYNVTITFNSSSSTVGATATKVEDVVVPDAVIDQVTISGDFGNWYNDLALEKTGDYTYQGVLDLTEKTTDISFKLTPTSSNSMIWIGPGQLTLEDENGWVSTASDGNFKLANSTSGYKTYTFTATWKHGSNAANGWTLKVEGKDKREEPIVTTYTVAGTPNAIFGTVWDETNTANDMTESNGIYTFTKAGVELSADDEIMFKVVENHSWDISHGTAEGENVYYKVNVTGTHDVTITFDPTVGIPEITLTDDEPVDKTIESVFLKGDFDNWGDGLYLEQSAAAANQFVGTLDLTNVTGDVKIKLLAYDSDNTAYWKGYAGITTLISDGSWLSDANDNDNILLSNSTTGYKTYTVTATWEGNDPETGWTLTIAGLDQRESTPVDGQELVNGDHKVVIKGVHYLNLAENNYVLTITSEETMTGLGGSFWNINGTGYDADNNPQCKMQDYTTVSADGKTLTVTATSNQDPQLYTPLYVLIKDVGEVNFGNVTIEWEEQQAEVTYQVTFVNEAGWEGDIYAYAWSGDGAAEKVLGEWPGTQMENEGNNTFSITLPSAAEYIIFNNNNGSQTADLAFVNNKQYTNAEEPADSYTVKFVNIAGWNDVYVYGWDGNTNSGWTANKAEKTSTVNVFGVDADVYECTISLSVEPKNLIFHNNDGTTQTQDLQWVEGATYSYDSNEAIRGYFLFTDDADQFKPAENVNVTGFASYARQFTPGNVCTVVLPFAIGADVAKAAGKFYRINSIADGYIRGTEETPAPYVPYIFIPATEYPFTNIGIGQLPAVQNNSITTAEGYTLQFVTGTTELASDASYDYYGFSNGKFVKAAYATVNPFRSYIKVAKSANAPATLIWTDDEATGISSLKADIQNGKANVYDLQGRRVLNPVRGLYIVNGKKVIVK